MARRKPEGMRTHALTFYHEARPHWVHPTPKVRFTFIEKGDISRWEVTTERFHPDGTLLEAGRCSFARFEKDLLRTANA